MTSYAAHCLLQKLLITGCQFSWIAETLRQPTELQSLKRTAYHPYQQTADFCSVNSIYSYLKLVEFYL